LLLELSGFSWERHGAKTACRGEQQGRQEQCLVKDAVAVDCELDNGGGSIESSLTGHPYLSRGCHAFS